MPKRIPSLLKNRYVLVLLGFLIYITFFDAHDLISQLQIRWKLYKINNQMEYLQRELETAKEQTIELSTDKVMLEKFAREQYRMKRENEDIYVILNADEE